jgi:hypothetical protein
MQTMKANPIAPAVGGGEKVAEEGEDPGHLAV